MRKPAKTLNARLVQTATDPGKYFDGHGLYLRVDKTGGKFWVQRIVINGKRTELGLGSLDFVTLADARVAAFANRKIAREGGDPRRSLPPRLDLGNGRSHGAGCIGNHLQCCRCKTT